MQGSGETGNRNRDCAALERLEDLADLRVAKERLRAYRDGKEDTAPLEEVMGLQDVES